MKILDFQQAKQKLGIQTNKALYLKACRGQVPVHRWGTKLVFIEEELDAFIAALPRTTVEAAVARFGTAKPGTPTDTSMSTRPHDASGETNGTSK